ncbi:MAG: hypothetical protein KKF89_00850 [Nanoarchaeota archaeon]|nr:hypothetical protein [Nanoarchaeota archaeon]MBU1854245.1 hypothetical protein [Nanoarchaeota archaeon]
MTCYAVPTTAAIVHFFLRKKVDVLKNNKYQLWLNQLFLGGAIFGVVDHLWNGELFLIGENLVMDLLLGVVISVVLLMVWGLLVFADKNSLRIKEEIKM